MLRLSSDDTVSVTGTAEADDLRKRVERRGDDDAVPGAGGGFICGGVAGCAGGVRSL